MMNTKMQTKGEVESRLAMFEGKVRALQESITLLAREEQADEKRRSMLDLETALQEREVELRRTLAVLEKERRTAQSLRAQLKEARCKPVQLEKTRQLESSALMAELEAVEQRFGEMEARNDALLRITELESADGKVDPETQLQHTRERLQKAIQLIAELQAENDALKGKGGDAEVVQSVCESARPD